RQTVQLCSAAPTFFYLSFTGRNELIARYIKLRTGKTRTRKQVSSHIQVLARKKVREYQAGIKVGAASLPPGNTDWASLSSLVTASLFLLFSLCLLSSFLLLAIFLCRFLSFSHFHSLLFSIKPFAQPPYSSLPDYEPLAPPPAPAATAVPVWQDRTIASSKLRLLEYSAFMEVQRDPDNYSKHLFVHIGQTNPSYSDPLLEAVDIRQIYDKFPEKKGGLKELYEKGPQNAFFLVKFWADLNSSGMPDGPGSFYGVSSQYSSIENMTITVSTKVCSFGKQVVEKVETEYARLEGGKCVYRIHRSPMCDFKYMLVFCFVFWLLFQKDYSRPHVVISSLVKLCQEQWVK
uniref:TEA domain transcription factor 3 n=1 Tax=Haplochromis burtoni TaxID=8153 RepID=A0A3Q2VDP1_HAPBU